MSIFIATTSVDRLCRILFVCGLPMLFSIYIGLATVVFAQDEGIFEDEPREIPPELAKAELVNVDKEAVLLLEQAQTLKREDRVAAALELLQRAMAGEFASFQRKIQGSAHYPSIADAAIELLGEWEEEVRARYEQHYGSTAEKLLVEALSKEDEERLFRIGRTYFHTRAGFRAWDRLGEIYFQKGEFRRACTFWRTLLNRHRNIEATRMPLLLGKAALAAHLDRTPTVAERIKSELVAKYPEARAKLGGQEYTLTNWLQQAMAQPFTLKRKPVDYIENWTATNGSSDGLVRMRFPERIVPEWAYPADENQQLKQVAQVLGIAGYDGSDPYGVLHWYREGGSARIAVRRTGMPPFSFMAPAASSPLWFDERIIFKDSAGIHGLNERDGKREWFIPLPLRDTAQSGNETALRLAALAGEMGRNALTYGAGCLYAVHDFPEISTIPQAADTLMDSGRGNRLSAFKYGHTAEPKPAWSLGKGQGQDELLRDGKYLTAPVFHNGRLYILLKYMSSYWMAALTAQDGKLLWKTMLGPVPVAIGAKNNTWELEKAVEIFTERGSPPAIADGLLYIATNCGIVVALTLEHGHTVWAYRYIPQVPSIVNKSYTLLAATRPIPPQNPLIVTQGRLICLPSDADELLVFDALTGSRLLRKPREGCHYLNFAEPDRIVLSQPGVKILDLFDGSERFKLEDDSERELAGRAIVINDGVLIPLMGKLLRISNKSGESRRQQIHRTGNTWGNLSARHGRVLAAGPLGLTCYRDGSEQASSVATNDKVVQSDQIENDSNRDARDKTVTTAKVDWQTLRQTAATAFLQGRFAAVNEAMEKAMLLYQKIKGEPSRELNIEWHSYACSAIRNATDWEQSQAFAKLAVRCSKTREDSFAVTLAVIEAGWHFEQLAEVFAAAQHLIEDFADVYYKGYYMLDGLRLREPAAYDLGVRWQRKVIAVAGEELYAANNRQMQEIVQRASSAEDITHLQKAIRAHPLSRWVPAAIYRCAELLFATQLPDRFEVHVLAKVSRMLAEIENYKDESVQASAQQALSIVNVLLFPQMHATLQCSTNLEVDTGFRFAGLNIQSLDSVIESNRLQRMRNGSVTTAVNPFTDKLVKPVYIKPEAEYRLLRDIDEAAIILGTNLFMIHNNYILRLNTAINAFEAAVNASWKIPESVGKVRYGVIVEQTFLVLLGSNGLAGLALQTGMPVYEKSWRDLRIQELRYLVCSGRIAINGDLVGRTTALDLVKGELLWHQDHRHGPRYKPIAASSEFVLKQELQSGIFVPFEIESGRRIPMPAENSKIKLAGMTSDGLLLGAAGKKLRIMDPRIPDLSAVAEIELNIDGATLLDARNGVFLFMDRDQFVLFNWPQGASRKIALAGRTLLAAGVDRTSCWLVTAAERQRSVGSEMLVKGVQLQVVELNTGNSHQDMASDAEQGWIALKPVRRQGDYLALAWSRTDRLAPSSVQIWRISSLERFNYSATLDRCSDGMRYRWYAPEIANGRLIIHCEDALGILVVEEDQ